MQDFILLLLHKQLPINMIQTSNKLYHSAAYWVLLNIMFISFMHIVACGCRLFILILHGISFIIYLSTVDGHLDNSGLRLLQIVLI